MPESQAPPSDAPGVNVQPAALTSSTSAGIVCACTRPHIAPTISITMSARDIVVSQPVRLSDRGAMACLRHHDLIAGLQVDGGRIAAHRVLVVEGDLFQPASGVA